MIRPLAREFLLSGLAAANFAPASDHSARLGLNSTTLTLEVRMTKLTAKTARNWLTVRPDAYIGAANVGMKPGEGTQKILLSPPGNGSERPPTAMATSTPRNAEMGNVDVHAGRRRAQFHGRIRLRSLELGSDSRLNTRG